MHNAPPGHAGYGVVLEDHVIAKGIDTAVQYVHNKPGREPYSCDSSDGSAREAQYRVRGLSSSLVLAERQRRQRVDDRHRLRVSS